MSTTTPTYPTKLDVSKTARVPFTRLLLVELRKMVDTRAGFWLLVTIGAVTTIVSIIFGLAGHDSDRTLFNFMQFAGAPQGFLLPVLGILLVTQEWSQRTGMVTFSLEPHRSRVLISKVVAALLVGIVAFALAIVVALLATLVFGGAHPYAGFGGIEFVKFGFLQITGILQGLAFGLLLLNTPAAIVLYFVLPTVFSILFNTVPALKSSGPWIDFGTAQQPIGDLGNLTSTEWLQLLVTGTIWVVLPFVAGLWRVLRAEVK